MYLDFEFDGQRLSDLGYVMGNFNGSSDSEIDIGCDITFTTIKNNHSSIHSKTSSSYENVYSTTFEILKNPCSTNDPYLNTSEVRYFANWLNVEDYRELILTSDIDDDLHYFGSFNIKPILVGGRIGGLSLTFTANTPYAFQSPVIHHGMLLNPDDELCIYGDGDMQRSILPTIKVRCLQKGDLEITNSLTGQCVKVDNCIADETITLDGEHKIILTDKPDKHPTLANDFNYEWFEIANNGQHGRQLGNYYSSTLPCELTVTYLPIRKVGVI